jgi:two-component system, chemotaxis family, sensor kinase CheA
LVNQALASNTCAQMTIDISQFYQVFFDESKEHLDEMEQLLLKLNVANPNLDQLNAIFRAAHSIKGGAATFGFHDMTGVTHGLESLLDRLRKQEISLQSHMIDVFLQATDALKMQLDSHIQGTTPEPALIEAINKQLFQLTADTHTNISKPATNIDDDGFGFFDDLPSKENPIDDGFDFFDHPTAPLQANIHAASGASADSRALNRRADDGNNERKNDGRRSDERRSDERVVAEANSIRVGVDKVDQLINLVGELVITQAMLNQSASLLDAKAADKLNNNLIALARNTRNLQESVMSIRMMPVNTVFNRFPRLVRDLAAKLNKEIELVMQGENTELDKGLIEKIADPLTHIIRNSVDHGIETPAARLKVGKQAKGKILLSASHQGGQILIEVTDDGAGLDRQRILQKAQIFGIEIPSNASDEQVWQLIFEPGFSTAEIITDVSGRGVGMDVVKRNISEMGGEVSVHSLTGLGSTISIRLPLTLAILDGMSVSLGSSTYVIPLNQIIETLQPLATDLKTLANAGAMVQVRGEYLPIIALHKQFNINTQITNPVAGILVIIEAQGKKAALLVDALLGQQQVVVKSIETHFRKVIGVSGATILGDGSVAMIIDVPMMIKLGQKTLQ